MRDFYLDRENRREYLIFMLNTLKKKYFVDISKVSYAIGIAPNYMSDLLRGTRKPIHETMDRIEYFISDLYESIIDDEIELNRMYIDQLSVQSKKE